MRQASKNVSFGLTARSIGDLQDIVRTLKARGATLRATEQPINRLGGATTAAVQRQELYCALGIVNSGACVLLNQRRNDIVPSGAAVLRGRSRPDNEVGCGTDSEVIPVTEIRSLLIRGLIITASSSQASGCGLRGETIVVDRQP
jgi:hypothetical protein